MVKLKRGQGGVEFMIIFGFVLIFFVLFFTVIQSNQSQKNKEKEDILFQNIALDVRDEINTAAGASEGYYREFSIPQDVLGKDYNVVITDQGYVYLTSDRYAVSFKASVVNGTINKGVNLIRKSNGTVFLN